MATITATPVVARRQHRHHNTAETLLFLGPLLIFIILLYGALLWTMYVSFADWDTIAPNYQFAGLKWYRFLVAQPHFEVDIANNLLWLLLEVIPTVVIAIFLAYFLELTPFPRAESYIRALILPISDRNVIHCHRHGLVVDV